MRIIVYFICASCILFPSCTFYYTTAEIDQNIKTTVESTESATTKSTEQINNAQEYDMEIQNLRAKFSGKFPKEIEKLNASITEGIALSNEINFIIASVDKSAYKFKTVCKGIDEIYSRDLKRTTINQLKQETSKASIRHRDIKKNQALVLSLK